MEENELVAENEAIEAETLEIGDEVIGSDEEIIAPEEHPTVDEVEVEPKSEAAEQTAEPSEEAPADNVADLREEIANLKRLIAEREQERDRMLAQLNEFSEIYPEKSLDAVPAEVWSSVRGGVPLAAAYALYEKKTSAHMALAREVNSKNAERSSGAVGKKCDCIYYSPAEVRSMSPAEVKKNYNIIIESMKKWN